jgi:uncharacterized SAM-binding protein YcdF (DUF218 family)
MFFYLSKILGFFALPSNFLITLGLFGFLLMATRFARAGRRLAAASVVLIAVVGLSPLGNLLIIPLEQRFPNWNWNEMRAAPDGIIVLGGAIGPELSLMRSEVSLNEAAERLTAVAALARRYPEARIVYSGGNGRLINREGNEAEFALKLFDSFGIVRGRIALENRSRNTIENAVLSRRIANPKAGERWWLVTSAYHMPRAIGAFRAAGFDVQAHPVDFRTRGWADATVPFDSVGDGLRRTDTAAREWIGLLAYWISGRSSALFPGPGK